MVLEEWHRCFADGSGRASSASEPAARAVGRDELQRAPLPAASARRPPAGTTRSSVCEASGRGHGERRGLPPPQRSGLSLPVIDWCLEEADVLGRELLAEGRTVFEFGKRRSRDFALFAKMARLIRRERVDVLHCHDELSWFYGAIAARLAARDTRVVMTMHGRRSNMSARHVREQRVLASMSSAIISVSEFLRQQLIGELRLPNNRVRTIRNGIALSVASPGCAERQRARAKLGIRPESPVIGSVGELSAVKNLDLALEATAVARRAIPDLQAVFIGDGCPARAAGSQGCRTGNR